MASFSALLVLLAFASPSLGQDPSCSTVKIAYRSKRLTEEDVPSLAVNGSDLRVCPKNSGKQCCSQRMEDRFTVWSKSDFGEAVPSKIEKLKDVFDEQAKIFDEYFEGLIKKSQQNLDTMFKKIYVNYYLENSKLFMDFFDDLRDYYAGKTSDDVNSIVDNFFSNLMIRMYKIMNKDSPLSDSYLACVSKQMDNLKPFGDIPAKLKPQMRKVLIYAKSFSQALFAGRDVVHSLRIAAVSSKECEYNLVKLKYCSWCKAMTTIKPCHKFCTDVYRGCVADLAKVNTEWSKYMKALKELLEKQNGPTNIHDVVMRLNLEISFAIMDFQSQDKLKEVKQKASEATECGSPGLTKRSTEDFFLEENNRERRESESPQRVDSSYLKTLSSDFYKKMRIADNFWSSLPKKICDDISVTDKSTDCWNGIGKGRYSYTSPDDRGDGDDVPNPTIRKANRKLEGLVDQLYAAINGDDVTPSGSGTGPWEGSGSGSGSASGEGSSYEVTTPDPTTAEPGNEIPDKNDKEVVEAGGVEEELSRVEHSSAQRQLFEWWSLSLTVCLLCIPLIA
ncbi:glypican-4-like isoform X1 [Acropora millepora]|uniref:glypican-4-like isoform X1 n=1 Tax=Acropora millepora TaxID=45264 RepID=UPI001CF44179|nr:glypican-4-like isoform X1 [Acropora millepora]